MVFSEVAFDREQLNSACSPCSDFFVRSCLQHKQVADSLMIPTHRSEAHHASGFEDLESAVLLKLTLVFLWKAYVVQESGQMKIVVGQHHVHIDRLNAFATSYPIPPVAPSRPPLRFIRDMETEQSQDPSPEVTTRLVTYSFSHDHQKTHNFSRGLCVIPVTLMLQNHSEREVKVVIDTSKMPESLSSAATSDTDSAVFPASASSSSSPRWVGLTQATLTLGKGHNSTASLKAGFVRPGTYNLNNLSVFVTYCSDQSQTILQKHGTPSIITLVDTS